MVLQQPFPGHVQEALRILVAQGRCAQADERLRPGAEQRLAACIALLDPDAAGQHARNHPLRIVQQRARLAQFALDDRADATGLRQHLGQIRVQACVHDLKLILGVVGIG